jgi:RNA recognition motif-containing protein
MSLAKVNITAIHNRRIAPPNIGDMFSVRVSNIPKTTPTEFVHEEFAQFGEIGDIFRPLDLSTKVPRQHLFVRYLKEAHADAAVIDMNGAILDGNTIIVIRANQDHFFTRDTGFISNMELSKSTLEKPKFDSSMPASHYPILREIEIKDVEVSFNIRCDDIPLSFSVEKVREIFQEFGEISSLYYPYNLKEKKPRGFAIIRYLRPECAENAKNTLHNTCLGVGRNVLISWVRQKVYFGKDESQNYN